MVAVATMKEVHTEAHEWKEPNEPVTGEDVCAMLGDDQKGGHSKKADENHPNCRPPKWRGSRMFVVVHGLSDCACAVASDTCSLPANSYDFSTKGALICVNRDSSKPKGPTLETLYVKA